MSMWITSILFIVVTYIWMRFRFFSLLPGSTEFVKYSTSIYFVYNCLFPPQWWLCMYIPVVSLILFACCLFNFILPFDELSWKIVSSLLTFHWTNNPNTSKNKWQFFCCRFLYLRKTSTNLSWRTEHLFTIFFPVFYFSFIISHNSHMFLYWNDINPWIEHLYMFWNI